MKIYVIMGHRPEAYEGEFAPEALDAIDEFTDSEVPELREDRLRHHESKGEFASVKAVCLDVPMKDIMDRLYPKAGDIKAKVL